MTQEPKLYEESLSTPPSRASNAASENDAASLLDLSQAKVVALYRTVNQVMLVLGMYGEISRRDDRVSAVMDALYDIDGGVYLKTGSSEPSGPTESLGYHKSQNTCGKIDGAVVGTLHKPLSELQIRSAVYGCSDGKCLCGRCAP